MLKYEKGWNKNLLLFLIYEFLILKSLRCCEEWKQLINKYKARLNAEIVKLKIKRGVQSNEDLADDLQFRNFPKFIRVNTIKSSLTDCIEHFEGKKFSFVQANLDETINNNAISRNQFSSDGMIDDLLVFDAKATFYDDDFYQAGKIFIQDKPSCFPAFILAPPPDAHVIDCCAAPGNKTTHLGMLMQGKGKIFAFEKDPKRFITLQKMTQLSINSTKEESLYHCLNEDFLLSNPHEPLYSNVRYILVDPSCSGSGMVSRLDAVVDSSTFSSNSERLNQLKTFQTKILMHAMQFPSVQRITYSTCSVHDEENEQVVEAVLAEMGQMFKLVTALPSWHRRGLRHLECVRVLPDDGMNGFFVALFERKTTNDL